jgi:hypothetical protein
MTLKEGILNRGLSHVIFESDSKVVIDAISFRHVGISEFSIVISHIKSLLLCSKLWGQIYQANMIAHHHLAMTVYFLTSRNIF